MKEIEQLKLKRDKLKKALKNPKARMAVVKSMLEFRIKNITLKIERLNKKMEKKWTIIYQ